MSTSQAAERYAQALLATLADAEERERYRSGMERLEAALAEEAALRQALLNPGVPLDAKLKVLQEVAGGQLERASQMFRLLLAKGRWNEVAAVAGAFCRAADRMAGVVRGRVEAAVDLTDAELGAIERRIVAESGKAVKLEVHTNPALLGGFRVVFEDQVWDESLTWQLMRLRQRLEEQTPA